MVVVAPERERRKQGRERKGRRSRIKALAMEAAESVTESASSSDQLSELV